MWSKYGFALCSWLLAAAAANAASAGEGVVDAVRSACSAMHAQRSLREEAAEAAAARFVQGGTLWVAGSIPRFDIEWLNRAGGIMPVRVMKAATEVGPDDVLVYGCLTGAEAADGALLRQVRERQGLVVAIAPVEAAEALREAAQFCLTVTLPADAPLRSQIAASAAIAALWAFSGDVVGACTRRGVMPTMWQSVMVPGARERNARYRPLRVHPDCIVSPQAAGTLGERYLAAIIAALGELRSELPAIRKAGTVLRETVHRRRTVFHANLGHFEPALLLPPDFPIPLAVLAGKDPQVDLLNRAVAGDALLVVWYTEMPTALLEAARSRGVTSTCLLAENAAETRAPGLADVLLDAQWVTGDAAVELPGYDVRILPPSGVLNSAIFFAILAEAQAVP